MSHNTHSNSWIFVCFLLMHMCMCSYCFSSRTCKERLTDLWGYSQGPHLSEVSIDCQFGTFSFAKPKKYYHEWYQIDLVCKNHITSVNVTSTLGLFERFTATSDIPIANMNLLKDSAFICVIQGCGTDNIDFYEIPATSVECIFSGSNEEVTIDKEALTQESLVMSWTPLPIEFGRKYLSEYLIRINATQLSQTALANENLTSTIELSVNKSENTYSFHDVRPFTEYSVQVFAKQNISNVISLQQVSVPTTIRTPESVPTEPINLAAVVSFTNITLTWDIPNLPNGIITHYEIVYMAINEDIVEYNTTSTAYVVDTLTPGQEYTFYVTAFTSVGDGPPATITTTTRIGVVPPVCHQVLKLRQKVASLIIDPFSTEYGPLSHYSVIVLKGQPPSDPIDTRTLYPYTDTRWEPYGYYVAAVFDANNDDTAILIGDNSTCMYKNQTYYNAPLEEGIEYRFFIRLFSASTAVHASSNLYEDSLQSNAIRIISNSTTDMIPNACVETTTVVLEACVETTTVVLEATALLQTTKNSSILPYIIIVVVGGALCCILAIIVLIVCLRQRRRQLKKAVESLKVDGEIQLVDTSNVSLSNGGSINNIAEADTDNVLKNDTTLLHLPKDHVH